MYVRQHWSFNWYGFTFWKLTMPVLKTVQRKVVCWERELGDNYIKSDIQFASENLEWFNEGENRSLSGAHVKAQEVLRLIVGAFTQNHQNLKVELL